MSHTTVTRLFRGGTGPGDWTPSSRANPCPVCDRTKDGDCRTSANGQRVICHHPKDELKSGDVVNGWAFTGNTEDGRGGHFVIDTPRKPRSAARRKTAPQPPAPAPLPDSITLTRLPEGTEVPDLNRSKATYRYSDTQQTRRDASSEKGKVKPWHHNGDRWRPGKGPDPWPLFMQQHAGAGWVLELEGERCAGLAMEGSAVAISQPGHDHTPAAIVTRYRELVAAGVAGVAYLADHDAEGTRKAEACAAAAAAAGLPFLHIPAAEVWPEIPAKGNIDDAPGNPAEQVAAIEATAQRLLQQQQAQEPEVSEDAAEESEPKPVRTAAGKRIKLAPDEVLAGLPEQVGQLRLDVRSGDVHAQKLGTLGGNAISRLYLRLSNHAQTWPKDSTVDAVAELASVDPFDPVADYLEGITAPALPLDQWQRLDQHLLGIDDPIAAAFLPRYLVSAVARVFEPGCSVRQSPVLIGPQQRGKTAMGRILFGGPLYVEGVKDLGKDALMRCHRAWGVELAELNGITRRADQEALKAFLTEVVDTYRRPYDRAPEQHPRRFVFWGTANAAPLRDLSGSTRFVCIPIPDRMLPLDWAIANRDALWARALEQYRAGVQWDRSTEDERQLIAERNANHQEIDPWADRVAAFLSERQHSGNLPVRLPEVLDRLAVPAERQTNALATRVRTLAEAMGWTWARRWISRKEGIKRQGLWPPVAHPVPPMAHPCPTPAEVSNSSGSAPWPTPSHPYSERVVVEGGAAARQGSAAQHASSAAPGGFEPFEVGQVGQPGNSSDANGLQPQAGLGQGWDTGVGHVSQRTFLVVGDVVEVLIGDPPAWVNGHRVALIEGDRVRVVNITDPADWRVMSVESVRPCSG